MADYGNQKVLTRKTSVQNLQTGEVIEREDSVLLRTKKRERFMLLYVENFNAIVNLQKRTQEILAQILAKKVTYGTNEVVLDGVFRASLTTTLGTSRQVVTNSIAELVDKKVLKREKRDGGYVFFLNPYLFGHGEWNTIEKQRQQFTIDYDFVNLTAEKEVKTITAYEGLPEKENIQVIKREQYKDEQGVIRDDAYIQEKDKEEVVDVAIEESPSSVADSYANAEPLTITKDMQQYELELLREQNRARELNIKEKELNIKELELRNKARELENTEKTLF